MLENGILVAIGLLVMLFKLPWRHKLWIVSHPVLLDVLIFAGLTFLHWGTFSGVMVATIGALFCSITLGIAKRVIGFVKDGVYVRGFFNVSNKL